MERLSDLEYQEVDSIKDWVEVHVSDRKVLNDFQGEEQEKFDVSSVALLILFPRVTEQSHPDNEPFLEWYNGQKSKLLRPRFNQAEHPATPMLWSCDALTMD